MNRPPALPETAEFIRKRKHNKDYNAVMRIIDIAKLHREFTRREAEQNGLPSGYRMMLFHLSRMEPGITQLQLVNATRLKAPTVSVTLRKMEDDGLVTRRSNEHDLRQTLVYLTEKGMAINDRIRGSFDACDRIALKGLDPDETAQLCRLLDKMIENLLDEEQNHTSDIGKE